MGGAIMWLNLSAGLTVDKATVLSCANIAPSGIYLALTFCGPSTLNLSEVVIDTVTTGTVDCMATSIDYIKRSRILSLPPVWPD